MISTRRVAAALGLAVGVTCLAAPLAHAALAAAPGAGKLSPLTQFDSPGANDIPVGHWSDISVGHRSDVPVGHQSDVPAEHRGDIVWVSQHWPR